MIDQKSANDPLTAPSTRLPHRRGRIRWLFVITAVLIPSLLVLAFVPFTIGFSSTWTTIRAPCVEDGRTPAAFGLNYQDVQIPARWGGSYHGFLVFGTRQATIIIPPTGPGGRGTMLDVVAPLAKAGYNVLTFESRLCVGKPISLGYREVEDVEDALNYLQANRDKFPISLDHVGLYGFSTAGATVTMAAARDSRFEAIVAVGNYANLSVMAPSTVPHDPITALVGLGFRAGYWLSSGEDAANLNPLAAIPLLAPRPVLLIYGSLEDSLDGARQQLAALNAADPSDAAWLWVVPGADHCGYIQAVGAAEYDRHLLQFFNCALFQEGCEALATF